MLHSTGEPLQAHRYSWDDTRRLSGDSQQVTCRISNPTSLYKLSVYIADHIINDVHNTGSLFTS